MFFKNLMGLIIFTGALLLLILTVSLSEIKRFAVFGLVSGLGIAFTLILLMQNWLGLWTFHQVDLLNFIRIPLFLSAAWVPAEIFFAHFLSQYQHPWLRVLLLLFLPAIAVGIHFILIWNQMLTYYYWDYWGTFFISLGIHIGLALYLNQAHKIPLLT